MKRTATDKELRCKYMSYDLEGWEGGVAACAMDTPSGGKVIAIPRLGLSTFLTGFHNSSDINAMLMKNRTLYYDDHSRGLLAAWIERDFAR